MHRGLLKLPARQRSRSFTVRNFHLISFLILFLISYQCHSINAIRMDDIDENIEEEHAFVSKVDKSYNKSKTLGWECKCYNITTGIESAELENEGEFESECTCSGKAFKQVPTSLATFLHRITITNSNIKYIQRDSFQPYNSSLHEVFLGYLPDLRVIERGTFRNIYNLQTLYISHAPQLKFLGGLFDGFESRKFRSLRIVQTSLAEIPDLTQLETIPNILHMLDLESNKIEAISANTIKISVDQVILSYNDIKVVEDYAFNGSQVHKLTLRGNNLLTDLKPNAFRGIQSLRQLDLSDTKIKTLPIPGLETIEVLKVENTPSLKQIPSIHDFPELQKAFLTHPFHCCAFKYPEQHDPFRHALFEKMHETCKQSLEVLDTGQQDTKHLRLKREDDEWGTVFTIGKPGVPNSFTPNMHHNKEHPHKTDHSHVNPQRGTFVGFHEGNVLPEPEIIGDFHNSPVESLGSNKVFAVCGNLGKRSSITCFPEPNALNPCEDIMGSNYLRISIWFVLFFAVVGNFAVIVVILFSGGELTVPRFFMCNLAFADLCMGLYLLLLASMDLHSVGTYFNYAFDWQYGVGCQIAGFLTVFASQLSIFTLTMVTIERWFAITYAINLSRRIRLGLATKIMIAGWFYSIFMAVLPLFGVSNYSSTSICLPMEVHHVVDQAYLITMILVNGLAFVCTVFCYGQIYYSLGYETRRSAGRGEWSIAKKMALLVFTDFACWAPIAFFALTALAGYPLIGVTQSKILLVFFYPLNSCANPYLYAIMTAQYRNDFFVLLARFGIFRSKAKKYSITNTVQTNNTPIPLLIQSNGRRISVQQTSALEDIFV